MSVVETVVDHPPDSPVPDDAGRSEQTHRLGHRCLGDVHGCRDVADTQLSSLQKGIEDPDPLRVAEQAEAGREVAGVVGADERPFRGCDPTGIHVGQCAAVEPDHCSVAFS